jgi:hypothetical protein
METTEGKPFAHQAAKASWASALILMLIFAFAGRLASRLVLDVVALFLVSAGFLFGLLALFGIPKHGAKGIFAPAIVGLLINGLLLFIFFTNFFAARERALQAAGKRPVIVKSRSR